MQDGYCYQYQVSDNFGNQASYTSANTVKVSTYGNQIANTTGAVSHWRLGEVSTSDTFSGTTGGTLQTHTGEIGATWTYQAGDVAGAVISSENRLRKEGTGGFRKYSSATPASANYSVEADLHVKSRSAAHFVGVIGRFDTSTGYHYFMQHNTDADAGSGGWTLYVRKLGGDTLLGTVPAVLTDGQTYRMRLAMNGSTISCWVNGASILSVTDANVAGAGRAGVVNLGGANVGDTTGLHLDNFVAAPLTPPTARDPPRARTRTPRFWPGPARWSATPTRPASSTPRAPPTT